MSFLLRFLEASIEVNQAPSGDKEKERADVWYSTEVGDFRSKSAAQHSCKQQSSSTQLQGQSWFVLQ